MPARFAGFSLIEMIIVLAIITIITAVALLGQNNFNKTLTLTDTAYTVAFSIREAQSLGLSSRISNGVQDAGYGVHLDNDAPTKYWLFADTYPASPGFNLGDDTLCPQHTAAAGDPDARPGNCVYNPFQGEYSQTYTLNRGFTVLKFCGYDSSNRYYCSDDSGRPMDHIDISFTRPSTQATIIRTDQPGTNHALIDARIYLQAPDHITQRCVYVSKLGQISVVDKGSTNCP